MKLLGCVALFVTSIRLFFGNTNALSRSVEIATPLTSLVRLAEGFWLRQLGLSPYTGSIYHGSPLLLEILGPITTKRYSHLIFLVLDLLTALLIRQIARILASSRQHSISKGISIDAGELAAVLYLLNPFTILSGLGNSTSPIENFFICLALYAGVAGDAPLAAFAWVIASHLSIYPIVLFIPIAIALTCGPDKPPQKVKRNEVADRVIEWSKLWSFLLWSILWIICTLTLCKRTLRQGGSITEMFKETYGFTLTVKDLTPNIGIYWYFFTEVFDFYRSFFLLMFHGNILCMVAPLSIRFHRRPVFLCFVIMAVISTLKSYPSLGDAALYLGLMGLFTHELSDFKYSFLLLNGYICVSILGPVMFNLWIWRGTGNANFYFATALGYAIAQTVLVVESVNSMVRHDRVLKHSVKKDE